MGAEHGRATVESEIGQLRARIRTADEQYYNRGHSDLTDAEYDALFARLRELEAAHPALVTEDSPTQRVGAPLPKGSAFPTVPHLAPMGSIESLMSSLQAQLEALAPHQHRVQQDLGAGLGARLADEALAMPAVLALAERHAVGVGVRARRVGRRHRERAAAR